jgi:hypothetical protein
MRKVSKPHRRLVRRGRAEVALLPFNASRRKAVAHTPPSGGRASELRISAHHRLVNRQQKARKQTQNQCQTGAADHAAQQTHPGATRRAPARATHDGIVIALRSDVRWCSDHLDGEILRVLFASMLATGRSSPGRRRRQASPARSCAT